MAFGDLLPWTRNRGLTTSGRDTDPFLTLRREMDRLFDSALRGTNLPESVFTGSWPNIDVSENDREYKITAELPGLEEKDVDLTLRDNVLTLSGEKRNESEEKDENRFHSERIYGRFQRSIPFPTEVDAERVRASFRNGVLTVTLPKSEKAQERTKHIQIQAG